MIFEAVQKQRRKREREGGERERGREVCMLVNLPKLCDLWLPFLLVLTYVHIILRILIIHILSISIKLVMA